MALVADCWLGLVESSALNVVEVVPAVVGVPVIPPLALSERPAGNDEPPLRPQVYGAVPPEAVSAGAVYGCPTVPAGSEAVVIVTGVILALMVKVFGAVEAVWLVGAVESVTVKVCVVTPLLPDKGVPLITPDEALRLKPFGNVGVTDQAYGNAPPVAVNCVLG